MISNQAGSSICYKKSEEIFFSIKLVATISFLLSLQMQNGDESVHRIDCNLSKQIELRLSDGVGVSIPLCSTFGYFFKCIYIYIYEILNPRINLVARVSNRRAITLTRKKSENFFWNNIFLSVYWENEKVTRNGYLNCDGRLSNTIDVRYLFIVSCRKYIESTQLKKSLTSIFLKSHSERSEGGV